MGAVRGPVLLGLSVANDGSVEVLYSGPGFGELFGGNALTAVDEPALLDSIRNAARSSTQWQHTWRVRDELEVDSVAHVMKGDDGITTLHGYVRTANAREDGLRFRSIVEASPVPYAINDEHQNITYVNPAFTATFGYSREDIPTLADWWPRAYPDPDYRQWCVGEWGRRFEHAKQTGTPFEAFEVRIKAKDQTDRFAMVGALSQDRGLPDTHVVALLDVTERKRAEQARLNLERQVQHSQKLESLGILAGGIAHDFNNLLMAIVGNASIALATLSEASPARASIEALLVSARRASQVADQMLAYSGRGKFVVAPLSLSELVAEMSQLLEVAVPKNVVLRTKLDADLPRFDGDATQVRQVIMNLLTNAAEAIGEHAGTVTLTTGVKMCSRAFLDGASIVRDQVKGSPPKEARYVYLSVTDTGSGMAPETRERIFEPFFTTKFTGRGLGLSALLGIVQGHEGAIEICSTLGKGTTFNVLFPASSSVATAVVAEAPAQMRSPALGRGLVLLVDDEEPIRVAVAQLLEILGYDVLSAADGAQAIELFRERRGDVSAVILDLTMPVLSGEQTFHQLRELQPDVKVILASGYSNVEVSRRFATGALAGFLKKPFDFDELQLVLADTIR